MDKDITVKRLRGYDELLADERYYKQQFQASEAHVAELEGLLSAAKCPNCDGSGTIQVETTRIVPGCCNRPLETGECCGNAIPEQVQDFEIEQCEWCYRKDAALTKNQ